MTVPTKVAQRLKQPRGYRALLRLIHMRFAPRTYVEVGVGRGRSLAQAGPGTLCVGIDPAPELHHPIPDRTQIFEVTSDEFFAGHDLRAVLDGQPVDFAFIDGMHLFEFALRDFIHLEAASGAGSVIAIHDCDPPTAEAASRQRRSAFWTGDVWKLVPCLRKHRPDLRVAVVDVPPSGLGIVANLDPSSVALEDRYAQICDEFVGLPYGEFRDTRRDQLNIVPGSWEPVRSMLPPGNGPQPAAERQGVSPRRPVALGGLPRGPRPATVHPAPRPTTPRMLRVGGHATTEVALCGYPRAVFEGAQRAAAKLDIRSGSPRVHRFHDLTYFPKLMALYDEHGRRVDETCTRRGVGLAEIHPCPPEQVAIPSRVRRIDQPVVYCGRIRTDWGHFLTESISRLWVLSGCDVPVDARLLFHRSKRRAEDFVGRFFDHAGVDRARFLDLDSPTTLRDVYVPQPTFALGGLAFSGHVTLPERVATAICGEAPSRSDQPIYLSRGRLAGARGARIEGESRLEEVLAKRGVKIVAPETLAYKKQVRLFNRYSIFIGCIGSAFHSLLYALPDRKPQTAVIASAIGYYEPGYYPDHFMIDALKCVRANYLYEPGDPSQPVEKATLDPGAAIRFLEGLSVI